MIMNWRKAYLEAFRLVLYIISSYIWKYYNRRNCDLSIQVGYRGRKGSYATPQGLDYFQEQNWSLIAMTGTPWRFMKVEKSFTDNSKCFFMDFCGFLPYCWELCGIFCRIYSFSYNRNPCTAGSGCP